MRDEARRTVAAIVKLLEEHGITDHCITQRGRHSAVEFTHNGARRFVTFSTSPTDRRGYLNLISHTRRLLAGSPRRTVA